MGAANNSDLPRVLFLSDGLAPLVTGGMQQHSTMLVKHMAPLVKHMTLMYCGSINGAVPSEEDVLAEIGHPANVKVIGVELVDRGFLPGHYLRASRKLSEGYLNAAGDLGVNDAIYAQGLTGDAFLGKHPNIMVNLHGIEMFQPGFSWRERLAKAILRPRFKRQINQAWRLVSLGGKLTYILLAQGVLQNRICVLPNGIESKWILSESESLERKVRRQGQPTRFVLVGRNEYRKGLHVLRSALDLVRDPIELHMIGDWPQWDAGIHTVLHHGFVREKAKVMSLLDACDVLLLPSLSEGMPTVILEALARGLDIIATDVGACSEMIDQKKLIPPADTGKLSRAIQEGSAAGARYPLERFVFEEIARNTLVEIKKAL